jgi:hypothetical protein
VSGGNPLLCVWSSHSCRFGHQTFASAALNDPIARAHPEHCTLDKAHLQAASPVYVSLLQVINGETWMSATIAGEPHATVTGC